MAASASERIGRYELHQEIARGGMATVHLGRLVGPVGFARTVAIKCLHPGLANDPSMVRMFIDEARLTARIRHPNVVPVVDVLAEGGRLYLVMDYVAGLSLARIVSATRDREGVPLPIALRIMIEVLAGLDAAHDATGEGGEPLEIVHRDVSPQNVIVGDDGSTRVLDFGIAKATSRMHETTNGEVKGKLAYMSPEQLGGAPVDRRSDVFAAAAVLWELLTGQRLFARDETGATVAALLGGPIAAPHTLAPAIPEALSAIVMRGLERDRDARYPNARVFGSELEALGAAATTREVADWVTALARVAEPGGRPQLVEEASVRTAAPPPPNVTAVLPLPPAPAPSPSPSPQAKRRTGLVAIAAMLGAGMLVTGLYMYSARDRKPIPPTIAATAEVAAEPMASGEPPVAVPSAAPSATAARAAAHVQRPRPAAPALSAKKASAADCRVVNADGTFAYRAECLR